MEIMQKNIINVRNKYFINYLYVTLPQKIFTIVIIQIIIYKFII